MRDAVNSERGLSLRTPHSTRNPMLAMSLP